MWRATASSSTSQAEHGHGVRIRVRGSSDADNDGVTKLQVKTGAATKSKAQLAAKGVDVILPNIDSEVTVQLVGDNGTCFSSTFVAGGVSKNDGSQFKAGAP